MELLALIAVVTVGAVVAIGFVLRGPTGYPIEPDLLVDEDIAMLDGVGVDAHVHERHVGKHVEYWVVYEATVPKSAPHGLRVGSHSWMAREGVWDSPTRPFGNELDATFVATGPDLETVEAFTRSERVYRAMSKLQANFGENFFIARGNLVAAFHGDSTIDINVMLEVASVIRMLCEEGEEPPLFESSRAYSVEDFYG